MYTFLKNYEHDDDCFFKAFAMDLTKIENVINQRRIKMGLTNGEIIFKLRDIDEKLKELGGRLEIQTLEEFNKTYGGEIED